MIQSVGYMFVRYLCLFSWYKGGSEGVSLNNTGDEGPGRKVHRPGNVFIHIVSENVGVNCNSISTNILFVFIVDVTGNLVCNQRSWFRFYTHLLVKTSPGKSIHQNIQKVCYFT